MNGGIVVFPCGHVGRKETLRELVDDAASVDVRIVDRNHPGVYKIGLFLHHDIAPVPVENIICGKYFGGGAIIRT